MVDLTIKALLFFWSQMQRLQIMAATFTSSQEVNANAALTETFFHCMLSVLVPLYKVQLSCLITDTFVMFGKKTKI